MAKKKDSKKPKKKAAKKKSTRTASIEVESELYKKQGKQKKSLKQKSKTEMKPYPESIHGLAAAGPDAHFAEVEYGNGFTQGTGDFNFIRVDARIRVPCALNNVDIAFEWARDWVETKVKEEFKDIDDELDEEE